MKAQKGISIDAYMRAQPKAVQKRLKDIWSIVRTFAPDATEKISYKMPAFFPNGIVVYFAGFRTVSDCTRERAWWLHSGMR